MVAWIVLVGMFGTGTVAGWFLSGVISCMSCSSPSDQSTRVTVLWFDHWLGSACPGRSPSCVIVVVFSRLMVSTVPSIPSVLMHSHEVSESSSVSIVGGVDPSSHEVVMLAIVASVGVWFGVSWVCVWSVGCGVSGVCGFVFA